jgi:hypothetical protein
MEAIDTARETVRAAAAAVGEDDIVSKEEVF